MKAKVNRIEEAFKNRPKKSWGTEFRLQLERKKKDSKEWIFLGHYIPISLVTYEVKGSQKNIWLESTDENGDVDRYMLDPRVMHLIDFIY